MLLLPRRKGTLTNMDSKERQAKLPLYFLDVQTFGIPTFERMD
jgi:hypothetical protein